MTARRPLVQSIALVYQLDPADALEFEEVQVTTFTINTNDCNVTNNLSINKDLTVNGSTKLVGLDMSGYLTGYAGSPADGNILKWVTANSRFEVAAESVGVTDHGALTGLGDDDHTQYALADGSRTFTTSNTSCLTIWNTGNNTSNASGSLVVGGVKCSATGLDSVVTGGYSNEASGNYSCILGGYTNTANNIYACVQGGYNNTASGNSAFIGGGYLNEASATYSIIGGGWNNTANGAYSTVLGGHNNIASGSHAAVIGGYSNTASGDYSTVFGKYAEATLHGEVAKCGGQIGTSGDCLTRSLVLGRNDGSGNYANLYLDVDGPGAATKELEIPPNSAWAVHILLCGLSTDGSKMAAYRWLAGVRRDGTAAPSFIGTPTVTTIAEDDTAWDSNLYINTTNNTLEIQVKTASGWYANWTAKVEIAQVKVTG